MLIYVAVIESLALIKLKKYISDLIFIYKKHINIYKQTI